jgi:hypothetical protein
MDVYGHGDLILGLSMHEDDLAILVATTSMFPKHVKAADLHLTLSLKVDTLPLDYCITAC